MGDLAEYFIPSLYYLISSFAFILSHYSLYFILSHEHREKLETIECQTFEGVAIKSKVAILCTPVSILALTFGSITSERTSFQISRV
jgi:hypothetical protein